ncbi:MAG: phosphoglycerate dehydrogenase [Candidatus Levybacteria bacterium]|nr:phosphoglycerate dehydrogenase [Candidatus Levybacteria bacterium]
MKQLTYYIIDFDSTFVTVEALDTLVKIALADHPKKDEVTKKVADITRAGMEGKIGFGESLAKRMALFSPTSEHIDKLIEYLRNHITPSIQRNSDFFVKYAKQIYIISGGFHEYMYPIVEQFGLSKDHVLANRFLHSRNRIAGYDKKNPLANDLGKVKVVKNLGLQGDIVVIGDGITDYQIKERGGASAFYCFTENVARAGVMAKADKIIKNFDEFLFLNNLPRKESFPKSKMKVLLLEKIDPIALDRFKKEGFTVETVNSALSENELAERLEDVSILGIRSKTEITENALQNAKKLLAIGAFCIGTNQITLPACNKRGIAIFNAPYSNTRSVVELALGEIILLYRQAFDKSMKLHKGEWDKSATGSFEVRGKRLGIIGYGNIGTQLGVLAEALGMEVYFYDIVDKLALGNAKKCDTLSELLHIADVVTVHIDGRKTNKNLIGESEFAKMKNGVIFLNLARGSIVDVDALAKAIKSGKVAGAGLDVYPYEPKSNAEKFESVLQESPNTILTPHIGGSTEEAQRNIGQFVSNKLLDFINAGNTTLSVNFPQIQLPELRNAHRFIHIHKNKPGLLAQINNILAQHEINIEGQYLKTNEEMGYVITDVSQAYDKEVVEKLREIAGTIRFRVLY